MSDFAGELSKGNFCESSLVGRKETHIRLQEIFSLDLKKMLQYRFIEYIRGFFSISLH